MNENIICKPNPAKTLAVSAAPLRELLNFFTNIIEEYRNSHPEYSPVSFEDLVNKELNKRKQREIREKADRPWWRRIFW